MGNFFSDLMAGGAEGLVRGVGQLTKDVRAALTGSEPLTADQKAAMLARADAMEAKGHELEELATKGQIGLNQQDALSGSLYKGGWRPLIGWSCAIGVAYEFVFKSIAWWLVQVFMTVSGSTVQIPMLPGLDMKELVAMTMTLLGMGGIRMWEKIKDKA